MADADDARRILKRDVSGHATSTKLKAFKLTLWLGTDLATGAFDEVRVEMWEVAGV